MHCSEFRDLMFERLSGETTAEQDAACAAHEQSCPICRAELAQYRSVQARLRAGWPAEEPMPISVAIPQAASRRWFDTAGLWFSRASAGLVAASLLLFAVARPSVRIGAGGVQVSFSRAAAPSGAVAGVSEAQLKEIVQAAVDQQMAQARPMAAAGTQSSPDAVQVTAQLRQLQRTQATLWEAVQQHGLYLENLWRNSESPVQPAKLTQ